MMRVLVGVGLGFLLFQSPQARQITAGIFRAGADLLDPQPQTIPEMVVEQIDELQK